jgi:hypothetical protein
VLMLCSLQQFYDLYVECNIDVVKTFKNESKNNLIPTMTSIWQKNNVLVSFQSRPESGPFHSRTSMTLNGPRHTASTQSAQSPLCATRADYWSASHQS